MNNKNLKELKQYSLELANYIMFDQQESESFYAWVEEGRDPLDHIYGIAEKVTELSGDAENTIEIKKYILDNKDKFEIEGVVLYRIVALRDFSDVKKGDRGGYIQKESNLSHEGDCWAYNNAWISHDAEVTGNARLYDDVWVYDSATVRDSAYISGNSKISGRAVVEKESSVGGYAHVRGCSIITGSATVEDDAVVKDYSIIMDKARIGGKTRVTESAKLGGDISISSDYVIYVK